MASSGSWFDSAQGKRFMAMTYGLGAAVVIMGALFKLMHWPFAGAMLTAGLSTEAIIFAISAFLPIHEDPDWTLVYPELAGSGDPKKSKEKGDEVARLNDMLQKAQIKQDTINRLGDGMKSLSTSVEGLKVAADATKATQNYTTKVNEVATSLDGLNKTYAAAAKSVASLGDGQKVSKDFYDTMQNVTQKLTQLNSVYELELKESNEHSKALGDYHGAMSALLTNLTATKDSTAKLKTEVAQLSQNLEALNGVYGGMLSAMGRK
ncbi:MAG: gliding motility protein GldL [Bacteroidetes bacterium]|nr:gliding motility protein GldL [Bacteroidota bacterium]